ncbi:MAG TPA: hypothetical protein VLW51_05010, partial [Solirubrobacteraceae bacterium]|nr:hypothetical protein [Solirubrobacteraceae bacterium]
TTAVVGYQQLYRTADSGATYTPVAITESPGADSQVVAWAYLGFTDATHGVGLGYVGATWHVASQVSSLTAPPRPGAITLQGARRDRRRLADSAVAGRAQHPLPVRRRRRSVVAGPGSGPAGIPGVIRRAIAGARLAARRRTGSVADHRWAALERVGQILTGP